MLIDAAALHADSGLEPVQALPHRVEIDLGSGTAACAAFADEAAAAAFSLRYAGMRANGHRIVCHVDAYRDRAGTHVFAVRGARTYRWPHGSLDPHGIAFLADAVVTGSAFAGMDRTLALHSAALEHNGSAFAIAGASNAGKTTTALACAFSGFGLYSDEFCVIREGLVQPFPRSISLRPGGISVLSRLDALSPATRARLQRHAAAGWPHAAPGDLLPQAKMPAPAPLRAVFSLRGRAARPCLRRVTALQLVGQVSRFAKGGPNAGERIAHVLRVLRSAICYELIVGDPNETVFEMERALEACEPVA